MTQVEKLLALIESKDAEIRLLRENLDSRRWPVEWDLSETQARILTGLYAGLWHRDKLITFVYRGNRTPRTALQTIGSRMTELRRKVPEGVHIKGVYRFGWQVPQSSMDILTAALEKQ